MASEHPSGPVTLIPSPRRPQLPPGVYIQPYMDKVPGRNPASKRAALTARAKAWKARGAIGLWPHAFTTTMPGLLPMVLDVTAELGLLCAPAFGLNTDDAAGKGERMARVAEVRGVAGIISDLEGKGEDEPLVQESAHVVAMLKPVRDAAPDKPIYHQPWAVPQKHRGWPWIASAHYCDGWCNQDYFNDWTKYRGGRRYIELRPAFDRYWAEWVGEVLAPAGFGDIPRFTTLQGYGWSDRPYDCVHAFLDYPTTGVWCEWEPEATVLQAIEIRRLLGESVGLWHGTSWAGRTAVRRFQAAYAAAHPDAGLVVDGEYGPATDRALRGSRLARAVRSVRRAFGIAA